MAISREQPMRPALDATMRAYDGLVSDVNDMANAVGSLSNDVQANTQGIADLNDGLSAETDARATADTGLGGRIDGLSGRVGECETNVRALDQLTQAHDTELDELQATQTAQAARLAALEGVNAKVRMGSIAVGTVAAGTGASGTVAFDTEYDSSAIVGAWLTVAQPNIVGDVTATLLSCDFSGLSYSVTNGGSVDTDVTLGYVAIEFARATIGE